MEEALRNLFFDACSNALRWGPGLLIAIVMLFGLYKLLLRMGKDVGMKIVTALEKPAAALNQQAASMDKLTNSIQDYVGRDQLEHKEIILLLKVISNKVNRIEAKSGS
jgi:hypothetical protein